MSKPEYDVELMAETAERMVKTNVNNLKALELTHGTEFAHSCAANLGIELLSFVIGGISDPAHRIAITIQIAEALRHNIEVHSAACEADNLLTRIKGNLH